MLPSLFDKTTIPILQETLSFTEARHQILAGNIANADTPDYKTRDLSLQTFQDRLRDLIEARDVRHDVASPGDLKQSQPGDEMRRVRDSMKSIEFLDGSNVGMEQQVTEVAKNQLLHNLSIAIMTSQFRLLQTAISERV